jgi:hypothetical protein
MEDNTVAIQLIDDEVTAYTHTDADAQALDDGVLLDLPEGLNIHIPFRGLPVNRISSRLYAELDPASLIVFGNWLRAELAHAVDAAHETEEWDCMYRLLGPHEGDPIWIMRNRVRGWSVLLGSDDWPEHSFSTCGQRYGTRP